jgi:hypothetical protein
MPAFWIFLAQPRGDLPIVRICCYPDPCCDYNPNVQIIVRNFFYPSESSFQDESDGTPSVAKTTYMWDRLIYSFVKYCPYFVDQNNGQLCSYLRACQ